MGLSPPKQNEIGYIYFLMLVRFDISLMLFNDISSRPDIRLHYWDQAALCGAGDQQILIGGGWSLT